MNATEIMREVTIRQQGYKASRERLATQSRDLETARQKAREDELANTGAEQAMANLLQAIQQKLAQEENKPAATEAE